MEYKRIRKCRIVLNSSVLRDAILSGAHNIGNHKTEINDLNIFPVPDGDTGTNMSMTIAAAASELQKMDVSSASAAEVAKTAASLMLRGARGNSGVILSLLFRGFAKGLEGKEEADARDLAAALQMGVDAAYKAVMNPTEGTILTVSRRSSGSSSTSEKTYTVSTEKSKNGTVKLSDAKAVKGDTVTITVKPEDGYVLDTLTVTDADGDEVKLKDKGDGKYTFTMPASKITVEATFVPESDAKPTSHPFTDVAAGTWIDTAVQYVYANGLMTGVSETEFAPSAATSRAMIWTILARRSGADTTGGANWYEKGQQWAIETGLMTGNGSGTLAPKAGATRAETAAMLMRFCEANQ